MLHLGPGNWPGSIRFPSMSVKEIPELLAPAGTLDAVRAAVANGADAVYLGASMYNARDEGAQLSLDELALACAIAHERGVRVYLTFNVLMKPNELREALAYLGECVDRGIDAAIVQDLGVVRLIQRVYPELEVHGSTQMTVHDSSGARVMQQLGIERVVLARENTLSDIKAIREAVPGLGLETFVHGALCISYSGQCLMSGMISERSANRGSCAQSCRKDYVLRDDVSGEELDRGYLISAKDLAAYEHLETIVELGVGCLKVEGRKKKPEYVATVSNAYRRWLDAIARGEHGKAPSLDEVEPLVQIFSRGNTGGMYGGRQGRSYVTRNQPDNRGLPIGTVVERQGKELIVEVSHEIAVGDGLGFEHPTPDSAASVGGTVQQVQNLRSSADQYRQRITIRDTGKVTQIGAGWRVIRTSDVNLLAKAQRSFASVRIPEKIGRKRVDVRCFGHAGGPLKALWTVDSHEVITASDVPLAPAGKHSLGVTALREQFGRMGDTRFSLGSVDISGLGADLFLPVRELNRLRQDAVEQLESLLNWDRVSDSATREALIEQAVSEVQTSFAIAAKSGAERHNNSTDVVESNNPVLRASVYSIEMAREAARGGAHEVILDPFLRHPLPSRSKVLALKDELASQGIGFRLRTPSIIRPDERRTIAPWLDMGLPLLSGHLGLVGELALGRNVIADYATNVFNQHTAQILFELGASAITASIELTLHELVELIEPWHGANFDVVVYGRTEGMTIEHCVLSAAFDRVPTTCRDLCVQKHPQVSLTDPTGYTFGVATDNACRNRLLHSRPLNGSEFIPELWRSGVRGYQMIFNVAGDPVEQMVRAYRGILDSLSAGEISAPPVPHHAFPNGYTRGHFVRAV